MKKRSAIALILGITYLVAPLYAAFADMCDDDCCAILETTCPMENHEESCPTMEVGAPLESIPAVPLQLYDTTVDLTEPVAGQIIYLSFKQTQSTPQEYSHPILLISLSSPLLI